MKEDLDNIHTISKRNYPYNNAIYNNNSSNIRVNHSFMDSSNCKILENINNNLIKAEINQSNMNRNDNYNKLDSRETPLYLDNNTLNLSFARESINEQIMLDWINTLDNPACLLVSSIEELHDGKIFYEILKIILIMHKQDITDWIDFICLEEFYTELLFSSEALLEYYSDNCNSKTNVNANSNIVTSIIKYSRELINKFKNSSKKKNDDNDKKESNDVNTNSTNNNYYSSHFKPLVKNDYIDVCSLLYNLYLLYEKDSENKEFQIKEETISHYKQGRDKEQDTYNSSNKTSDTTNNNNNNSNTINKYMDTESIKEEECRKIISSQVAKLDIIGGLSERCERNNNNEEIENIRNNDISKFSYIKKTIRKVHKAKNNSINTNVNSKAIPEVNNYSSSLNKEENKLYSYVNFSEPDEIKEDKYTINNSNWNTNTNNMNRKINQGENVVNSNNEDSNSTNKATLNDYSTIKETVCNNKILQTNTNSNTTTQYNSKIMLQQPSNKRNQTAKSNIAYIANNTNNTNTQSSINSAFTYSSFNREHKTKQIYNSNILKQSQKSRTLKVSLKEKELLYDKRTKCELQKIMGNYYPIDLGSFQNYTSFTILKFNKPTKLIRDINSVYPGNSCVNNNRIAKKEYKIDYYKHNISYTKSLILEKKSNKHSTNENKENKENNEINNNLKDVDIENKYDNLYYDYLIMNRIEKESNSINKMNDYLIDLEEPSPQILQAQSVYKAHKNNNSNNSNSNINSNINTNITSMNYVFPEFSVASSYCNSNINFSSSNNIYLSITHTQKVNIINWLNYLNISNFKNISLENIVVLVKESILIPELINRLERTEPIKGIITSKLSNNNSNNNAKINYNKVFNYLQEIVSSKNYIEVNIDDLIKGSDIEVWKLLKMLWDHYKKTSYGLLKAKSKSSSNIKNSYYLSNNYMISRNDTTSANNKENKYKKTSSSVVSDIRSKLNTNSNKIDFNRSNNSIVEESVLNDSLNNEYCDGRNKNPIRTTTNNKASIKNNKLFGSFSTEKASVSLNKINDMIRNSISVSNINTSLVNKTQISASMRDNTNYLTNANNNRLLLNNTSVNNPDKTNNETNDTMMNLISNSKTAINKNYNDCNYNQNKIEILKEKENKENSYLDYNAINDESCNEVKYLKEYNCLNNEETNFHHDNVNKTKKNTKVTTKVINKQSKNSKHSKNDVKKNNSELFVFL